MYPFPARFLKNDSIRIKVHGLINPDTAYYLGCAYMRGKGGTIKVLYDVCLLRKPSKSDRTFHFIRKLGFHLSIQCFH